MSARKVGLPLDMAAKMINQPPELVLTWISEGRRLQALGAKDPTNDYRKLCRKLADGWDSALPGTIAVLRGFMFEHARKDPKACVQALTAYEREYHERTRRRALPAELGEDAEAFAPLDIVVGNAAPRTAKFTRTNPDGSTSSVELNEGAPGGFDAELAEASDEDLAYFTMHGEWPKDAPKPYHEVDSGAEEDEQTLDTFGEVVDAEPDYAELAQALSGKPPPAAQSTPGVSSPVVAPKRPTLPPRATTRPPSPIAGQPPALRRIEPLQGPELGGKREVVVELDARPPVAPAPAAPQHPPLRRIDPGER